MLKAGFDGGYIGGYGHHGGFGHHGGIGHHGGWGNYGGYGNHGYGRGHGCCPPKVFEKREDGYLVADFQEAGRAKTIGAESTCFERVRDDCKRGGERKNWC